MMTRKRVLVLAAGLVLAPAGAATHAQNDAGTGADAPDMWEAAVTLPPGAYAGELWREHGDPADWYRFEIPADKILRVSFATTASHVGRYFRHDTSPGAIGPWDGDVWRVRGDAIDFTGLSAIRMAVSTGCSQGCPTAPYLFEAELYDPPDVEVQAVEVRPAPSPGEARPVLVTVANVGQSFAYDTQVFVRAFHPSDALGQARVITRQLVDKLAPEGVRTLVMEWDTTGQIGQASVAATATTWADADPSNDGAATSTYVIADTDAGIDLLNQRYGSTAGINHDYDGTFAFAQVDRGWPVCVHVEAGRNRADGFYYRTGGPLSYILWLRTICAMPPVPP